MTIILRTVTKNINIKCKRFKRDMKLRIVIFKTRLMSFKNMLKIQNKDFKIKKRNYLLNNKNMTPNRFIMIIIWKKQTPPFNNFKSN